MRRVAKVENGRGWVKFKRTLETELLISREPRVFQLLAFIAINARRTSGPDLKAGEAYIRYAENLDWTEGQFRAARAKAERNGLAAFRTTNRLTIGKLVGTAVSDINIEPDDEQNNGQTTDKQRTNNEQKPAKPRQMGVSLPPRM